MRLLNHRTLPLVGIVALLPLLGLVATPTARTDPAGSTPRQQNPADQAASCGRCHTDIYGEWKGRSHANAWVDKIYQAQLEKKTRKKNCLPCHIPQSALDRLGKKPKTRNVHKDEGVTCVTCHQSGGVIHGPFGAATPAHPTKKHDAFTLTGSNKLCAGCHRTSIADVLGVARDHAKVFPAQVKQSCVECHMPEVERALAIDPQTKKPSGPVRKGRSHIVLGPGDADFCGTAFGLSAKRADGQTILVIENKAGHRVPGLKLRVFEVHVALQDAAGGVVAEHKIELTGKDPLGIDPLQREFPFPLPAGATAIQVRIDHLLMGEKLATVLTQTLKL